MSGIFDIFYSWFCSYVMLLQTCVIVRHVWHKQACLTQSHSILDCHKSGACYSLIVVVCRQSYLFFSFRSLTCIHIHCWFSRFHSSLFCHFSVFSTAVLCNAKIQMSHFFHVNCQFLYVILLMVRFHRSIAMFNA